jgi:LacI family transcriptional regulator
MRVSLRRIAEETGVSINTVSQILNRKGTALYRAETCELVLAAAKRLGYRPNASARFMLTGRFDSVALLQSGAADAVAPPAAFYRAVVAELQAAGLHLLLTHVPPTAAAGGSLPQVIGQWMTDGFLIDSLVGLGPDAERQLDESGRPGVWVNHRRELNAVFPDDRAAAEALAEALLARGLGPVAYVDYSYGLGREPGHYSEGERRAGYAAAVARRGLQPRLIGNQATLPRDQRHAFTRAWLAAPDRPRAVVAGTIAAARAVVAAALAHGLRLPDDLAVATFAEAPVSDLGVPVTSWIIDQGELGRAAAAMLVRRIAGEGADQPSLRLLGRLDG